MCLFNIFIHIFVVCKIRNNDFEPVGTLSKLFRTTCDLFSGWADQPVTGDECYLTASQKFPKILTIINNPLTPDTRGMHWGISLLLLALCLTCGRSQVTSPCSLAMGVEPSQSRDVSSEGKSGSSNRASPPHSALPSSFMAPASSQPGSHLLGQRGGGVDLSQLWSSSIPPCTFHTCTTPENKKETWKKTPFFIFIQGVLLYCIVNIWCVCACFNQIKSNNVSSPFLMSPYIFILYMLMLSFIYSVTLRQDCE